MASGSADQPVHLCPPSRAEFRGRKSEILVIQFTCKKCGAVIREQVAAAGTAVSCAACGAANDIPLASPTTDTAIHATVTETADHATLPEHAPENHVPPPAWVPWAFLIVSSTAFLGLLFGCVISMLAIKKWLIG